MAKDAKQISILQWSGKVYTDEPSQELITEHTIDETAMAAIWAFKIFELMGQCATHAEESDMLKYRALASILGAGRIRDTMQTQYWFEGRELAVMYAALCNVQNGFVDKSRMNLEKTLMRNAVEHVATDRALSALRCAIKSQASMMASHTAVLMDFVYSALDDNHRLLLTVE